MSIRVSCQCGRTLLADERHAGKSARCPHCRAAILIPNKPAGTSAPAAASATPYVPPETMRANRKIAGQRCPICATAIQLGDEVRNCLDCRQSYHLACWQENKGCATYGCPSAPVVAKAPADPNGPATPAVVSSPSPGRPGRGNIRIALWLGVPALVVIVSVLAVVIVNHVRLQSPLDRVISQDFRNSGIHVSCHYDSWINPSVVVFDLTAVAGDKSRADVFRVLWQYAEKMKDQDFKRVQLAFKGKTKYVLRGSDFRNLGTDYSDDENPLYVIRMFPQKLLNPDGTAAFPVWTGGVLGVAAKQMEDFTTFNERWYGSLSGAH